MCDAFRSRHAVDAALILWTDKAAAIVCGWVSPYVKAILPNVVGLRLRIAVQQSEIGLYPPGENCCRKSIRRWEFVTRP